MIIKKINKELRKLIYNLLQEYIKENKDIFDRELNFLFRYYLFSRDFPVKYYLEKINKRYIYIICKQNNKLWRLRLNYIKFINNVDYTILQYIIEKDCSLNDFRKMLKNLKNEN